jgi:hypothetical protein
MRVNPVTRLDIGRQNADDISVLDEMVAFFHIVQSDLVAHLDIIQKSDAVNDIPLMEILQDHHDIVMGIDLNEIVHNYFPKKVLIASI